MQIEAIKLMEKSGGKSGHWLRENLDSKTMIQHRLIWPLRLATVQLNQRLYIQHQRLSTMSETVNRDPSCESDYDPNSLPVSLALSRIQQIVTPVCQYETIKLSEALNRVLAEDIASPVNVPNHTNSAMDGYAVRFKDICEQDLSSLVIIGKAFAGHLFSGTIGQGQAVRIMTGAVIPHGSDTIIMQEDVEVLDEKTIRVDNNHKQGQHVRYAGESLKQGDIALPGGRRLNPADVGLLASLGVAEIRVYKKPKVAIFSTGDEVKPLGEPLSLGDVYDSNRYTLNSMLSSLNVDVIDLGIIGDDAQLTAKTFATAAQNADAIIVCGGASVGDADYVRTTLNEMGQVSFWKLAMKPGRPLSFGKLKDSIFFGLPGNPVSVMVTFYQFVLPALKRLMGEDDTLPKRFNVPCVTALKKRPGRTEYQRGCLFYDDDNVLKVKTTGQQGSGILSSMTRGDCFIVLADDCDGIEAGALVEVEPFFGLM